MIKYLLLIPFLLLSASSFGQVVLNSLVIDYSAQQTPITKIFNDLEDKYELNFAYSSDGFKEIKADVNFKATTIETVLEELTSQNNLEFKILDDVIMVRKTDDYQELSSSQNYKSSFHLRGKVVDAVTNEPMSFATVNIINTTIGTYTDDNGHFDIEVPSKYAANDINIRYLGYEDQNYQLKATEVEFILVPLNIGSCKIEEINIVNREMAIVIDKSGQALGVNKNLLNNTTSGLVGNDLSRNLQLMPGINANDDSSAEIKIRGSGSDETLIILDGIPVYNASHYYGVFSSVNANYIEQVNLYKNTFPIHYGGKTAGVVEMLSDVELNSDFQLDADINLLTASVNLNLPITPQSNVLFSGRSTLGNVSNTNFNAFTDKPELEGTIRNFMDGLLQVKTDPNFKFYDINAKYLWQPNKKSQLSINLYSSNDNYENNFRINGKRDERRRTNLEVKNQETWSNLGASLIYNTKLSSKYDFHARVYTTAYDNESFVFQDLENKSDRNTIKNFKASQFNFINDLGAVFKLNTSTEKYDWSLGVETVQHNVSYDFSENGESLIADDRTTYEVSPFVELKYSITKQIDFIAGLRSNYYNATDQFYFSPRLSLVYNPSDYFLIKGSVSQNQQFLRTLNYEYRGQIYRLWVSSNDKRIPVIQSNNYMIGSTFRIGNTSIDIEAFNKDMTGMLEFTVLNPNNTDTNISRDYRLFSGIGRSRGIDALFSHSFKNYDSYLSYTWSKTEHSYDAIFRGKYFATEDDRRHQFKWINELHLGDISLGANLIYITGRPYVDIFAFDVGRDIRELDPNQRIRRVPAYQRLDLSAGYKFALGKNESSFNISLFNALDHDNVSYQQLVASNTQENERPLNTVIGSESNLLGRTLNLSLNIKIK